MCQTTAKKLFQIEINPAWCKGCTICVLICPKKVFEMNKEPNPSGYSVTSVIRPEKCSGCLACELHCPDLAIEVKGKKNSPHLSPLPLGERLGEGGSI